MYLLKILLGGLGLSLIVLDPGAVWIGVGSAFLMGSIILIFDDICDAIRSLR